jgi:hypothetical protein
VKFHFCFRCGLAQPRTVYRRPLIDSHEPTHFNNVAQVTSRFPTKIVNIRTTWHHRPGLRAEPVRTPRAAGVRAFHSGGAVRPDRRWDAPVDAALVARWRARLDE